MGLQFPTNSEIYDEETNTMRQTTDDIPHFMKEYMDRFGDASFTICTDCVKDQSPKVLENKDAALKERDVGKSNFPPTH